MVIFNSYVSLPEGTPKFQKKPSMTCNVLRGTWWRILPSLDWILAESACENSWKTIEPPLFHKVYSFLGPVDPYFHAEIWWKIITFFEWSPPTGILSDVYSDRLSDILSGIHSDIFSGMWSGPGMPSCIRSSQFIVRVQTDMTSGEGGKEGRRPAIISAHICHMAGL